MSKITISNISYTATDSDKPLHILDDLSFEVIDDEFVCLLGPSGCGKSTLLKIISGMVSPDVGTVIVDGFQRNTPRLGMMFQNATLMGWRTVAKNLSLPLELLKWERESIRLKTAEWIERLGLYGFEEYLPANLSGGMAQRVSLGRALIHDPDYLLFDEPFGALDALTREQMATELLAVLRTQRKPIIMVTHSISEAILLADKIIVLSNRPGKIITEIQNPFARPRHSSLRFEPGFQEISRQVHAALSVK